MTQLSMKNIIILLLVLNSFSLNAQNAESKTINNRVDSILNVTNHIKGKLDSCCCQKKKIYKYKKIIATSSKEKTFNKDSTKQTSSKLNQIDTCSCNENKNVKSEKDNYTKACPNCTKVFTIITLCLLAFFIIMSRLFTKQELIDIFKVQLKSLIPHIPITLISWAIGFCLLINLTCNIDFSGRREVHYYNVIIFLLSIGLIFLPFLKSMKIGNLIAFERKLEEAKQEVRDFKTEMRQMLTMVTSNINNHNANTFNHYYGGNQQKMEEVKTDYIDKVSSEDFDFSQKVRQRKSELIANEDLMVALARTRMRLEFLLRNILEKRTIYTHNDDIKYLTLNKLYKTFISDYPGYRYTQKAFGYVQKVCNDAIHGQKVPPEIANEVLEMGAALIEQFSEIINNNDNSFL